MYKEFRGVLEHAKRAAALFGDAWDLSDDRVRSTIAAAIDSQATSLNVQFRECDPSQVDWAAVMHASAFRLPPFQPGTTEKGFRDAIVCETFHQVIGCLTGGDTAVLVTNDNLVAEAIKARMSHARLVPDLATLRDEINLRVSLIDADTAVFIEEKAARVFINFTDFQASNTLWARAKVSEQLWTKFGDHIRAVPAGAEWQKGQTLVGATRLVRKAGNQVVFVTTLVVKSNWRYWVPDPPSVPPLPAPGWPPSSSLGWTQSPPASSQFWPPEESPGQAGFSGLYGLGSLSEGAPGGGIATLLAAPGKFVTTPAQAVFEVHWTGTYSRYKSVISAKLTDIVLHSQPSDDANE